MKSMTITGTDECQTCGGSGRIDDADSRQMRKCLDCTGEGRVTVYLPIPELKIQPIERGDKEIFIISVNDDGYHRIEIQLSRDDCNTDFAENFGVFLVRAVNSHAELLAACSRLVALYRSNPRLGQGEDAAVF